MHTHMHIYWYLYVNVYLKDVLLHHYILEGWIFNGHIFASLNTVRAQWHYTLKQVMDFSSSEKKKKKKCTVL